MGGYTYRFGANWTVDTSLGLGYRHTAFDRYVWYPPVDQNRYLDKEKKNSFGPTGVSVAIAYTFKL